MHKFRADIAGFQGGGEFMFIVRILRGFAPDLSRVWGDAGAVLPDNFDAFHVDRVKSVFTVSLWMQF